MAELMKPELQDIAAFFGSALVALLVAGGTYYVSDLHAEQSRLRARIGALESKPAEQVTVSPSAPPPSPSPTRTAEPSPSASPDVPRSSGGGFIAAAPGDRPVSRSPRTPGTGGSSPASPANPPSAASPSEPDCPDGRLLTLCIKASLLSGPAND